VSDLAIFPINYFILPIKEFSMFLFAIGEKN